MSTSGGTQLNNMSAPPRTEVKSAQVAADGQLVIFSTPHACLAAGLVDVGDTHPINWRAITHYCYEKWNLSAGTEAFLRDAAAIGVTPDSIAARVAGIRGSMIGWHAYIEGNCRAEPKGIHKGAGFCADLELTLAIRSRCVAGMFLARRTPNFSTGALFHQTFCVCDRRFHAPTLRERPWAKYVREFAQRRKP